RPESLDRGASRDMAAIPRRPPESRIDARHRLVADAQGLRDWAVPAVLGFFRRLRGLAGQWHPNLPARRADRAPGPTDLRRDVRRRLRAHHAPVAAPPGWPPRVRHSRWPRGRPRLR